MYCELLLVHSKQISRRPVLGLSLIHIFGDGCEVEMLASEENAEVVSDREKEGN